ncbi:hypothetical protein TWF481_003679 [Arthrobotrys musiformis]|uniref:Uncharacterized protein n=1 Tax=Arthrobotrys musiformis TaxID=47236 RepID=A0AAV9WID4_9PEZI
MRFTTASVLSFCVAATLAAPSRRSTMGGSQKTLGGPGPAAVDQIDRIFAEVPLSLTAVREGEIGVPASSLKFSRFLDTDNDLSDVILLSVDLHSLKVARKEHDCDFAFAKERKTDEEYIYGYDPEERLAVFRKEESGLWSVRCMCMPSLIMPEDVGEMPEEDSSSVTEVEDVAEVPDLEEPTIVVISVEDLARIQESDFEEEPKETKEITEEITEVTTEVTTKVTTKVTTEVTRKKSSEDSEEASEGTSETEFELTSTNLKRSIDSEGDDSNDEKSQRGVAVNEFDIEIII